MRKGRKGKQKKNRRGENVICSINNREEKTGDERKERNNNKV